MPTFELTEQFAVADFSLKEQFAVADFSLKEQFEVQQPMTLGAILTYLAERVGLVAADFDFSGATQVVEGFAITSRSTVRDIIAPLLRFYFCDLAEFDGKLNSVNRGGAVAATISSDDLGAYLGDGKPPATLEIGRRQDVELPRRVDVGYFSTDSNFQQASQGAVRQSVETSEEEITVNTSITTTDDKARRAAESLLYDEWLGRTSYKSPLALKWLALAPGDVINLPTPLGIRRARVVRDGVGPFGPALIEAVADDPSVVSQYASGLGPGNESPDRWQIGDTTLIAWNGNALLDEHADSVGLYLAATGEGSGWMGCVVYISQDGGASYQPLETLNYDSVIGEADTVLAAGESTGIWDDVNTVDVTMIYGAPISRSDAEVLAGENACLVGDEVLQFGVATALGDNGYRLSHLLRGRWGTDAFWGDHAASERFVLLEEATVRRAELGDSLINKTILLKAVSAGMTLAEVSPQSVSIYGREYFCYPGCSVAGSRDGGENLTITWKRRSRKDADLRDYSDIPLSETTEAYEVDVMDGATVKRTIEVSTPSAAYSAADQTTDFGSPQASVDVRIYQLGKIGRGYVKEATV